MSTGILEWKLEPASPLLDAERDAWLFFEDDDDVKTDGVDTYNDASIPSSSSSQISSPSSSPTRAEAAQQLLADIEDLVKKENEESFSNWFEEKVPLPIFDEISTILPTEEFVKPAPEKSFEGFGYFQLTPPQSPPAKPPTPFILPDENVRIEFQPAVVYGEGFSQPQNFVAVQPTYITLLPANNPVRKCEETYFSAPPTPIPDIERELAVVDEVVRDTAKNLAPDWDQFESESSHSDASSESFACSSPQSTSTSTEEETDDPEWTPDDTEGPSRKRSKTVTRVKPYSRTKNVEDKRLRKKEQNKNAATRYRQKKKAEVSEILEEEKQLEDHNAELQKKVGDIQTEIKYLKNLMRDLFKAKGLLK